MDELELTLAQRYEIEKGNRAIDQERDIEALRGLCKCLLTAWASQKAATAWMMRQTLVCPPKVKLPDP